jgi:hypothetical protein
VARDSAKLRAYNQVLQQIQNRIKMTATLPGNPNYLLYTVPPFILGLPAIDLQDCIVYIVHQLRTGGFEVRFTYPNLLYISWKHYESEYNRQQNPIIQAMTPAPQSTSKKGAGGKRGLNDRGPGVTFATSIEYAHSGNQAPPRSATEYTPPDAFLQNLARPAPKPMGNGVPNKPPAHDILADLWKFT